MNSAGLVLLLGMLVMITGLLPSSLNEPAHAQEGTGNIPREEVPSAIETELADESNDIPDTAIMLVYSNTQWSGSIIGSDLGSSPSTGEGDGRVEFRCEGEFGKFSASFQKSTDEGYLVIAAIQSGNLLNSTSTEAPLGIASMAGLCKDAMAEPDVEVVDSDCLIATAAFGSELAPQVQYLRDFRDGRIMSTAAGSSFMNAFNAAYYSFSPHVAEYERGQPWLQQIVRITVYPLLGILTMSEGVYSANEGEPGAIAAGLVASAMIGAVYLAPLAFSIRQVREMKVDYRILALIAAGASTALILSIYEGSTETMMVTTSAFVLSVCLISALLVAWAASRIFERRVELG